MASVMAIVSKKIFDAEARGIGVGDVWATDRYVSKTAALRALDAGGSLFLVTVRPPDERLWLVAVLAAPSFDGERWNAPKNQTPVADVTAAIAGLRFANGAGVRVEPGKLGMALQTPRVLTDADVALLAPSSAVKTPGKKAETPKPAPEAPAMQPPKAPAKAPAKATTSTPRPAANAEPARATEAIAAARARAVKAIDAPVAASLDAVAAKAGKASTQATKGFKEAAQKLGQTEAARAVLDWGVEALAGANAGAGATSLYKAARALEKKLGLPIDEDEAFAATTRLARAGGLDEATLATFLRALAKRKQGARLAAAVELVERWLTAKEPDARSVEEGIGVLSAGVAEAFDALARAAKAPEPAARSVTTRLVASARAIEPALVAASRAELVAAIDGDAALAERMLDLFPLGKPTQPWRELITASSLLARAAALPGDGAARWVERLLAWADANRAPDEDDYEAWLDAALARLAPAIAERTLEVRPAHGDAMDVGVVEALLRHGAKVATPEGRGLGLYLWASRPRAHALDHIGSEPALRPLLERSFSAMVTGASSQTAPVVSRLVANEGLRFLLDPWIDKLRDLAAEGTVASLELASKSLGVVLSPETLAAAPSLGEAVAAIDLAELVVRTLRAGILDELCWPLQDEVNDRLASEPRVYDCDGPFPFFVVPDKERRHVVVLGPDGVAIEADLPPSWPPIARSMRFVDGDLFYFTLESSLALGRWLSKPDEPFDCKLYPTWTVGARTPKGATWDGQHVFTKGERFRDVPQRGRAFSDGERFWMLGTEIDPDSGAELGASLPRFFAEVKESGGKLDLGASTHHVVPRSLTSSPLGTKDGLAAFRVYVDREGRARAEGIDGRVWEGEIDGYGQPIGLLEMPAREGLYPLVPVPSETAILTPDVKGVVVPDLRNALYSYWAGAAQWLPLPWWHYLVPRDLEGSRALARASIDAARELVEAARASLVTAAAADATKTGQQGTASFAITGAGSIKRELLASTELLAAVERVFPEITAKRLRVGVAGVVRHAAWLESRTLASWRGAAARRPAASSNAMRDGAVGALTTLFGRGWTWGEEMFEASVRDADAFLRGAIDTTAAFVPLHGSHVPWRMLFLRASSICRRVAAPCTPDAERAELRRALELWAKTSMAAEPDAYRAFVVRFGPNPPPGITHEHALVGASLGHRYALQTLAWDQGATFAAIERGDGGAFVDPAGGEVLSRVERATPAWDAARIRRTLALFDARGAFPASPDVVRAIAERTGLLYPSALVLWAGAHPWEMSRDKMQELGLKRRDLALVEKEITFSLDEIYDAAAPLEPEALFDPLAKDSAGKSAVDRLVDAWVARLGVRTPLDVELLARMEEDFHATKDRFHRDIRLLEEPETYDWLKRDARWVVRPWKGFRSATSYMRGWIPPGWPKHESQGDEEARPDSGVAFGGAALRTTVRLFAYAALELPAGDRHRAGAARVAELVRERLANPDLLLLAGAIDLSRETDPAALAKGFAELRARFDGEPYRAVDGGAAAPGVDRGDLVVTWPAEHPNSLFLAFRPARIRDAAALDRLAKDLGVYDAFRRTFGGCSCGLNFGRHPVVDITELREWLVWIAEPFQRLLARLGSPRAKPGRFEADPRESAPAIVDAVRARHDLSAEAAALYLALATLPDPDAERAKRYLAIDAPAYGAAAASLISKKLVVAAKQAGTQRELFLPGEVLRFDAPIAPMEAHKPALYGLEPVSGKVAAPFGVVLPLAPLDELFANAWRAIGAG